METPTVPPMTSAERRAELSKIRRRKGLRGFLIGLVVAQLLIAGILFGGEQLLKLRPELRPEFPLRVLVFLGIAGGIAFTGALTTLLLLFQGLAYVVRPRGKPLGIALWNGIRRVARAVVALGATLLVVGGTAAAAIPPQDWGPHAKLLRLRAEQGYRRIQESFRR